MKIIYPKPHYQNIKTGDSLMKKELNKTEIKLIAREFKKFRIKLGEVFQEYNGVNIETIHSKEALDFVKDFICYRSKGDIYIKHLKNLNYDDKFIFTPESVNKLLVTPVNTLTDLENHIENLGIDESPIKEIKTLKISVNGVNIFLENNGKLLRYSWEKLMFNLKNYKKHEGIHPEVYIEDIPVGARFLCKSKGTNFGILSVDTSVEYTSKETVSVLKNIKLEAQKNNWKLHVSENKGKIKI